MNLFHSPRKDVVELVHLGPQPKQASSWCLSFLNTTCIFRPRDEAVAELQDAADPASHHFQESLAMLYLPLLRRKVGAVDGESVAEVADWVHMLAPLERFWYPWRQCSGV